MKRDPRLVVLLLLVFALPSFAQQSKPPRERVQKTAPAPTTQQAPGDQPPQPATPETESRERRPERATEAGSEGADSTRNFHFDMAEQPAVQTHHQVTIGGRSLHYTATTGRLPIKDAEGKAQAEMFYVAGTSRQ